MNFSSLVSPNETNSIAPTGYEMATSLSRYAEGTNDYLFSILNPSSARPTVIPDLDQVRTAVKRVSYDFTYSSTDFVLVWQPRARGAPLMVMKKTTHPSTGAAALGVVQLVDFDDNMATNWLQQRLVSAIMCVKCEGIPAGAFNLTGRFNAALIHAPVEFDNFDPDLLTSFAPYDSINGLSIVDGVVSLALPVGSPAFRPTVRSDYLPGAADATWEITYASGDAVPSWLTDTSTGLTSIVTTNSSTVASWVGGSRGFIEVDAVYSYTGTAGETASKRLYASLYYINSVGALTQVPNAGGTYGTYVSYAATATTKSITYRRIFYSDYPVSQIQLFREFTDVDCVTTAVRLRVSHKGYYSDGVDSPNYIIQLEGGASGQTYGITSYANFEVMPRSTFLSDCMFIDTRLDTFSDFTDALMAVKYDPNIKGVMSAKFYAAMQPYFAELCSRKQLKRSLHAFDFNKIWEFGSRALPILRKLAQSTESIWNPVLDRFIPGGSVIANKLLSKDPVNLHAMDDDIKEFDLNPEPADQYLQLLIHCGAPIKDVRKTYAHLRSLLPADPQVPALDSTQKMARKINLLLSSHRYASYVLRACLPDYRALALLLTEYESALVEENYDSVDVSTELINDAYLPLLLAVACKTATPVSKVITVPKSFYDAHKELYVQRKSLRLMAMDSPPSDTDSYIARNREWIDENGYNIYRKKSRRMSAQDDTSDSDASECSAHSQWRQGYDYSDESEFYWMDERVQTKWKKKVYLACDPDTPSDMMNTSYYIELADNPLRVRRFLASKDVKQFLELEGLADAPAYTGLFSRMDLASFKKMQNLMPELNINPFGQDCDGFSINHYTAAFGGALDPIEHVIYFLYRYSPLNTRLLEGYHPLCTKRRRDYIKERVSIFKTEFARARLHAADRSGDYATDFDTKEDLPPWAEEEAQLAGLIRDNADNKNAFLITIMRSLIDLKQQNHQLVRDNASLRTNRRDTSVVGTSRKAGTGNLFSITIGQLGAIQPTAKAFTSVCTRFVTNVRYRKARKAVARWMHFPAIYDDHDNPTAQSGRAVTLVLTRAPVIGEKIRVTPGMNTPEHFSYKLGASIGTSHLNIELYCDTSLETTDWLGEMLTQPGVGALLEETLMGLSSPGTSVDSRLYLTLIHADKRMTEIVDGTSWACAFQGTFTNVPDGFYLSGSWDRDRKTIKPAGGLDIKEKIVSEIPLLVFWPQDMIDSATPSSRTVMQFFTAVMSDNPPIDFADILTFNDFQSLFVVPLIANAMLPMINEGIKQTPPDIIRAKIVKGDIYKPAPVTKVTSAPVARPRGEAIVSFQVRGGTYKQFDEREAEEISLLYLNDLSVSPSTVKKKYSEMESHGLINTKEFNDVAFFQKSLNRGLLTFDEGKWDFNPTFHGTPAKSVLMTKLIMPNTLDSIQWDAAEAPRTDRRGQPIRRERNNQAGGITLKPTIQTYKPGKSGSSAGEAVPTRRTSAPPEDESPTDEIDI